MGQGKDLRERVTDQAGEPAAKAAAAAGGMGPVATGARRDEEQEG
jgi:hypothetical protein